MRQVVVPKTTPSSPACAFHIHIQKAGSWLSYGDLKLGQGREAAKVALRQDKKLAQKIEKEIWAAAEAEDTAADAETAA